MNNELYHYGVLGMKWGVRRYQRKDGTLTSAGKKHKAAAIKGLEESRSKSLARATQFEAHTRLNKKTLDESIATDKKTGETSWTTQALTDAHRATGREYVNAKYHAAIYDAYVKAYSDDTIKVGQDYVTKNLKRGVVSLTDSGRQKEYDILTKVTNDFDKKYADEIKRYS